MSGQVDYRFRDLVHSLRLQFIGLLNRGDTSSSAIQKNAILKNAVLDLIQQSHSVDPKDPNNLVYLQSISWMLNQIPNHFFLKDINLIDAINAYARRSTMLGRLIVSSHGDRRSQYAVAYQLMILQMELEGFKNILQSSGFQDFVIGQIQTLLESVAASLGRLETQHPDLMSFEPDYPVTPISSISGNSSPDECFSFISSPSPSPSPRSSPSPRNISSRRPATLAKPDIAPPIDYDLQKSVQALQAQRHKFTDLWNNAVNKDEKRLVKIQLLMAIAEGSFSIASKGEARPNSNSNASAELKRKFALEKNNVALAECILGTQLGKARFLCGLWSADSLSVLRCFQKARRAFAISGEKHRQAHYVNQAVVYFEAVKARTLNKVPENRKKIALSCAVQEFREACYADPNLA